MTFPGSLLPESNLEKALIMVLAWIDVGDTLWTDALRFKDSAVGCRVVWKEDRGRWQGKSFYLGRNNEVFDVEWLRAIYKATARFSSDVTPGLPDMIFADAQVAIQRCACISKGPCQYLTRLIIEKARIIVNAGSTTDIRFLPGHKGILGNGEADKFAESGGESQRYDYIGIPRYIDKYVSFAHLKCHSAPKKGKETVDWSQASIAASRGYLQ
jgi:hypothetical protein